MKLKITYPPIEKRKLQRKHFLRVIRWPVLFAVVACPIVNLAVGGRAWSLIVLMSIYMAWSLILSPDLVEYNRISQSIKVFPSLVPCWPRSTSSSLPDGPSTSFRSSASADLSSRARSSSRILTDKNRTCCRCCFSSSSPSSPRSSA